MLQLSAKTHYNPVVINKPVIMHFQICVDIKMHSSNFKAISNYICDILLSFIRMRADINASLHEMLP